MIRVNSDLHDFLHHVYSPLTMISAETLENYSGTVRLFDRFACRPTWSLITPEMLGAFFQHYIAEGGTPVTALSHYRALHAILRQARRRGLLRIRVSQIPQPKPVDKLPVAWSVDEFTRIVSMSRTLPGRVGRYPLADWMPGLLLTCWSSDWRISAVMSIKTVRVNLEQGYVVSIERKTRSERFVELVPDAVEALRKIWGPREELFGDWRADRFSRQWKKLNSVLGTCIRLAGVRDIGRFHAIRRTATTAIAASEGVDAAARFAGHSNYRVTVKHYIDPTQMPRVGSKLPRLNLGG